MVAQNSARGIAPRFLRTLDPQTAATLRYRFRSLNRVMVALWRTGVAPLFGRWPSTAGTILVIHHVGRITGQRYATPVNYAESGEGIFCIAAFGERTDWYRNAIRQPQVEVWTPTGRWMMEALDANDRSDRVRPIRRVLLHSGFAAPLFGLHPKRMSDAAIQSATADYVLVRLRRLELLGPIRSDLVWIWGVPVVVCVLRCVRRGPG